MAYPYGIPSEAILPLTGKWVNIPGRPESAPPVFKYDDHPLRPRKDLQKGHCYLSLVDSSKAAADAVGKKEDWDLPHVTAEDADSKGWLRLNGFDAFMLRPVYIGGDVNVSHEDDVLRAYVVPQEDMPQDLVDGYLEVRDSIIGPVDACSLSKPCEISGKWVHGTHFERLVLAKGLKPTLPNKPRARVYAIGQSQQVPNSVITPNVEAKLYDGEDSEDIQIRRTLARLGGKLSMKIMETVLPEETKTICDAQRVLGNFALGTAENLCFGGSQLNIATPEYLSTLLSGGSRDLSESLGQFGSVHVDAHDFIGGMSTMTVFSKLYPGIHPGLFCFPESHSYIELPDHFAQPGEDGPDILTVLFSGLHRHGGMPPYLTKDDTEIPNDSVRLNHIMYPMGTPMSGKSIFPLCSLPSEKKRSTLDIVPEMYHPDYDNHKQSYTDALSYGTDGRSISDEHAVAEFTVQKLGTLVFYALKQCLRTPSFDPVQFLKSISDVDEDGNRITFEHLADVLPCLDPGNDMPDVMHRRQDAWRKMKELSLRHAALWSLCIMMYLFVLVLLGIPLMSIMMASSQAHLKEKEKEKEKASDKLRIQ
ncbi:hypothetical protein FOMPIDRAFT_92593 [Fomitopsis schrenkii]|uniref:Uncharacterized protein n=1 Tax=Fomitopsis schrenkii TaxID=2126942 RepID=S8F476_FOMSC|nr:hypothetical protein FOMPIDRAFT_92593 [Fomitopsis schrenkii]